MRWAVSLSFLLCGFAYTSWGARLPLIQKNVDISNSTLGIALFFVAIGSVFSMPTVGWLIHKVGSKKTSLASLVGLSIAVFLLAGVEQLSSLYLAFFGVGFFTGALDISMNTQAVLAEKKAGKPIVSSFHAFFSLGMVTGALFASFISGLESSLYLHFSLVSIVIFCLGIFLSFYLIENKKRKAQNRHAKFFQKPKWVLVILGIVAFCSFLSEGAVTDWSTVYLTQEIGVSESQAPIALSIFSFTMMLGRFLGDKMRLLFGDISFLRVCAGISSFGFLIALSALNFWLYSFGMVLVGFGVATIVPIAFSKAGQLPGVSEEFGLTFVTSLGYVGFLSGPPLLGLLSDTFGLRLALASLIVFLVTIYMVTFRLNFLLKSS